MAGHDHPIALAVFLSLVATGIGSLVNHKLHSPSSVREGHGAKEAKPTGTAAKILEAVQKGQAGDLQGAVELLDSIVRAEPTNVDALFNLAVALAGIDRYSEADRALERVLELSPQDWEAVAERASNRAALGQSVDAFRMLESIPVEKSYLITRMEGDLRWERLSHDPRLNIVRAKHGLPLLPPPPAPEARSDEGPSVAQHTDPPVEIAPRDAGKSNP